MVLNVVSVGLVLFAVIIIILGIIKIHTYPGKIAKERNHPQTEAIEVTSLLGLLIFPLWMAALVWAYSGAVIGVLYDVHDATDADESTGGGKVPVDDDSERVENEPAPRGAR